MATTNPSLVMRTRTPEGAENTSPFDDLTAGRGAWRAAVQSGAFASAELVRTTGSHAERTRCSWDVLGGFMDRSQAHSSEVRALLEQLTAAAPEGFVAQLDQGANGPRVIFDGPNRTRHSLLLEASDEARIRAHWHGYLPEQAS